MSRYDPILVLLSVLVAGLAAFTALELARRISQARARAAWLWLGAGAVAMGGGVWSMHFIGMLAFRAPTAIRYDIAITLVSLLIAIGASALALFLASRPELPLRNLVLGGCFMGAGICAMHYTGMAAMRMSPAIEYDTLLVAASLAIAIGASIAAAHLAFSLRGDGAGALRQRVGAAVLMGLAISGMHYTGMAAMHFAPGAICTVVGGLDLKPAELAYIIGTSVIALMTLTLLISVYERRLSHHLKESDSEIRREARERLRAEQQLRQAEAQFKSAFEEAPIGMALLSTAGRWLRVNPAFCRMLGYTEEELLALDSHTITHPDDRAVAAAATAAALAKGSEVHIEKRYLHKSGRPIWVRFTGSLVPDQEDHAALQVVQVEDITEYKRQGARIDRLIRVHALLSEVSSFIVRARRREDLFAKACQTAVEQGGFRFAWIGMADAAGKTVTPVAFHGVEDGYLSTIMPYLQRKAEQAEGPATLSVRTGVPVICNDIATDPLIAPWAPEALRRGYRAMVVLPLQVKGSLAGCFLMYASEPGAFDDEEMKLLSKLASDISYALEYIIRGEETDYLVFYDALTGLANRRLFLDRLAEHLREARCSGRQLGVVTVDLDRFKAVNDAWGQITGDKVLVTVAERILAFVGDPARVSRVAGDRYALIIPGVEDPKTLAAQLRELLGTLGRPMVVFAQQLRIAARAGVALFPVDGEDAETLLKNAESSLKQAKRSDDEVCLYTQQLSTNIRQRMDMENRLRSAIEAGEFLLHYQPKVDLQSGRVCGVEALIRWEHPELGLVPPLQFVPLLEETGLIREVGLWILEEAVRTYRAWNAVWPNAPRIAVNVSAVQMRQPDFVAQVQARLGCTDGSHGIDIEVTESLMLDQMEVMFGKLEAMRAMGVRIAIDDFGTGYSSLAYISRLPAHMLKIDRSFVAKMTGQASNVALVSTVISLAHSLHLKVIAEGVESDEQLRFLRMLKCDEVQGYLFSKPVPGGALQATVRALEDRRLGQPHAAGPMPPPGAQSAANAPLRAGALQESRAV